MGEVRGFRGFSRIRRGKGEKKKEERRKKRKRDKEKVRKRGSLWELRLLSGVRERLMFWVESTQQAQWTQSLEVALGGLWGVFFKREFFWVGSTQQAQWTQSLEVSGVVGLVALWALCEVFFKREFFG